MKKALIVFVSFILFLFACSESLEKKKGLNIKHSQDVIESQQAEKDVTKKFVYWDEEINVINSTLKDIVPHEVYPILTPRFSISIEQDEAREKMKSKFKQKTIDSLGKTLFVNEGLLTASSDQIDKLIALGADKLLKKVETGKIRKRSIRYSRLENFEDVDLNEFVPFTYEDRIRNVGGVNLTRVVFNMDKTKAMYIVHFSRFHDENSELFCAVEVNLVQGDWQLTRKTCGK